MLLKPITNPGKCARSLAVLLSIWAFIYLFSPFNLCLDENKISYNDEAIWGNRHDICRPYGWKPYQPRQPSDPPRKLYDLVLVTTELDLLEVRLNTTWDAVDYYVLVESAKTFTGRNKPLLLRQALDETPSRFETYKSKIIYHQVQYPEDFSPPPTPTPPRGFGSGSGSGSASASPWEDFHLNAMFDQVFPLLEAETKFPMTNPNMNSDLHSSYPPSLSADPSQNSSNPSPRRPHTNDILLLSLAPEIPRPHTLGLLRECFFPGRLTLSSKMHYYSFQFVRRPSWFSRTQTYGPGYIDRESREVEWSHPQATVYRGTGTRGKTVKMGGAGGLRYGSRSGVIAGIGGGKWWNGWMGKGNWAENWWARWEGRETLRSAGWTCEACFPTLAQFLLKTDEVYGPGHRHSLMNSDTEKERIVRYVREGKDLWSDLHEREEEGGKKWVFEEVVNNTDVPSLLLESEEGGKEGRRLGFLMERGGRSGGFRDYEVPKWVGVGLEDTENGKEGEMAMGKQADL